MKTKGWIFSVVFLSIFISFTAYCECTLVNNIEGIDKAPERQKIIDAISSATDTVCFAYTVSAGHVEFDSEIIIAKNITIQNLRISSKGVIINSGDVTIEDSLIQDLSTGTGIRLNGGNLTLKNTTVKNTGTCVDVIAGNLTTIDDSVLQNCSSFGINISGGTSHEITDSKISCVNKTGYGIYTIKNMVLQGSEVSNCNFGVYAEESPAMIIGSTNYLSLLEMANTMNKFHDNNSALKIVGSADNVMFAFNSFYENTTPITIDTVQSVNIAQNEASFYLNCIVDEEDTLRKSFIILDNADELINENDKFVVYLLPENALLPATQGKDYFSTCVLHNVGESDFADMDKKDELLAKYSNKIICDLTNSVSFDSLTDVCGNGKYATGLLYRESEVDGGFNFTSTYSNKFPLTGGVVAIVGTLETPTTGEHDDDAPTGVDNDGDGTGGGTTGGDDEKKQDYKMGEGAGGGGSTPEGSGMSAKMCDLDPNAHVSSKQVSLFGIWWVITFGIVSHFRRQAKKARNQ